MSLLFTSLSTSLKKWRPSELKSACMLKFKFHDVWTFRVSYSLKIWCLLYTWLESLEIAHPRFQKFNNKYIPVGSIKIVQGCRKVDNWGGGGQIFIYSCSASFISFESDCFYSLWTWIYEYLPSQLSTFQRPWNCAPDIILCKLSTLDYYISLHFLSYTFSFVIHSSI